MTFGIKEIRIVDGMEDSNSSWVAFVVELVFPEVCSFGLPNRTNSHGNPDGTTVSYVQYAATICYNTDTTSYTDNGRRQDH